MFSLGVLKLGCLMQALRTNAPCAVECSGPVQRHHLSSPGPKFDLPTSGIKTRTALLEIDGCGKVLKTVNCLKRVFAICLLFFS